MTACAGLAQSEDILKPLVMACESKQPKLVAIAVYSLQKIVAHGAIAKVTCAFFFFLIFFPCLSLCTSPFDSI
jgi:hypothetical protein